MLRNGLGSTTADNKCWTPRQSPHNWRKNIRFIWSLSVPSHSHSFPLTGQRSLPSWVWIPKKKRWYYFVCFMTFLSFDSSLTHLSVCSSLFTKDLVICVEIYLGWCTEFWSIHFDCWYGVIRLGHKLLIHLLMDIYIERCPMGTRFLHLETTFTSMSVLQMKQETAFV